MEFLSLKNETSHYRSLMASRPGMLSGIPLRNALIILPLSCVLSCFAAAAQVLVTPPCAEHQPCVYGLRARYGARKYVFLGRCAAAAVAILPAIWFNYENFVHAIMTAAPAAAQEEPGPRLEHWLPLLFGPIAMMCGALYLLPAQRLG